jgi:regulator of sigma E protease
MSFLLAIVALSVLIIVHEAGHYFVARWSGMRVERFSLGFGPAILKWRHGGTQFQVAPIFFGGFVHITGMNPHEEYDDNDPSVYPNRPTILRFLTILAGPLTNMIFATVLMFSVFAIAGQETATGRTLVAAVMKDAPAEGRLLPGDIIVGVDGDAIASTTFRERVQRSQGAPIHVDVKRAGKDEVVTITPHLVKGDWLIGVTLQPEMERRAIGVGGAFVESMRYPVIKSEQILGGLWSVVTGKVAAEAVGPVGMTSIIAEEIRAGWIRIFELLAMLSVYLCLINLLPLPALDGGRLVFLAYELTTRRRPNPKIEAAVHMAGFVVLLILMLLVTFKDIKNLFS